MGCAALPRPRHASRLQCKWGTLVSIRHGWPIGIPISSFKPTAHPCTESQAQAQATPEPIVGDKIRKEFRIGDICGTKEGKYKWFSGRIKEIYTDTTPELYHIRYTDGDEEDMTREEVKQHLVREDTKHYVKTDLQTRAESYKITSSDQQLADELNGMTNGDWDSVWKGRFMKEWVPILGRQKVSERKATTLNSKKRKR